MSIFVNFTPQCRASKRRHVAKSAQVNSATSPRTSQLAPDCSQGFALPIKIQFTKELSERDKMSRLQLCNEFLGLVKNNSDIVNTVLMSDEAHCHVSGYVINRSVATGLQTADMNFTSVLCIVQK